MFRIKNIKELREESTSNNGLEKTLSGFDLIILGISAIIGTGIFVLIGPASQYSGPALPVSMLISGILSLCVALIYTEIASMIPTSGSMYSYSYIVFGQLVAWIIAMLLIMEFTLGAASVASGWSAYVMMLVRDVYPNIPDKWISVPNDGGIIDLPAIFFTLFITFISVRGTKNNNVINIILVLVKISAILLFVILAAPEFEIENWQPFVPHGFSGIVAGSASVFLAFSGFDALATSAEECKNPKKDMFIGIVGSLLICTILYIALTATLTGMVPFTELNNSKPLAHALNLKNINIGAIIVSVGGIVGMISVMIVYLYAQSRILMIMARDGLMPRIFTKIHKKHHTPYVATITTGIIISILASFLPIDIMGKLSNLAILLVFSLACIITMILRIKFPDLERPFKCPAIYVIGPIATIMCCYLASQLIEDVGRYLLIWLSVTLVIYLCYKLKLKASPAK
jgi:APA family basic amino acid/polyamine antiporter